MSWKTRKSAEKASQPAEDVPLLLRKDVHAGGGLQLCLWSFSSAILEVILLL